ncbi:unnamed protein product, partial [Closterium sp. NIES-53]
ASSGNGDADREMWHERLCHINIPMLQKLVKDGSSKEWMPRAQRESGHKVKVIRTENRGEFIGADFEAVLKKKGIHHQLIVPYNTLQNGVAERFNRTLQEGARTLLGRAGLQDPFWVTALREVALGWLIWDLTSQQLTVSRDVKFLESFHYKEWKQQQQKHPTTPLIIEADEVQQPSRQVQVIVSEEEISGVTEDGGEPEEEEQQQQQQQHQQQQQQQQDAAQGAARPADRPRRDVRPPNRLTYPSFGKPKVSPHHDEVQQPSRQVQVIVSEEEISGVTEDGGEPEEEEQQQQQQHQQQQQQQQDAAQGAARPADRPRRDVRPPNRLTYPSFGKPKVVRAGSVAEQCNEEEIAHCY